MPSERIQTLKKYFIHGEKFMHHKLNVEIVVNKCNI